MADAIVAVGGLKVGTAPGTEVIDANGTLAGIVKLGTTVTSGAATGDLVFALGKRARWVNALANGTLSGMWFDSSERLNLNFNAQSLRLHGMSLSGTAGAVANYLNVFDESGAVAYKIPLHAV